MRCWRPRLKSSYLHIVVVTVIVVVVVVLKDVVYI